MIYFRAIKTNLSYVLMLCTQLALFATNLSDQSLSDQSVTYSTTLAENNAQNNSDVIRTESGNIGDSNSK